MLVPVIAPRSSELPSPKLIVTLRICALLFAGVQALQLRLQAEGVPLPYEVMLALPYVLTIIAIAFAGRNASYPAALLKPYKREG